MKPNLRIFIQCVLLLAQIGAIVGCCYGKWQWVVVGIVIAILLAWNSLYLPIHNVDTKKGD